MRPAAVALAAALCCACGGKDAPPPPTPAPSRPSTGLGDMMGDTAWDTQVMREASAAANDVVRNAADCEAARAIIPEAKVKLEAARPLLRTAAGRGSLDALRQQVGKVEELCPPGS